MTILSIAYKDLQIFFKERGVLIYLFALPIMFIMLFSGLGAGVSVGSESRLPLPVVNNDPGGTVSEQFLAGLQESDKVEVNLMSDAEANEQLSKMDIRYALFIPAGFSADLASERGATFLDQEEETESSGPQTSVYLIVHPDHDQTEVSTIERVLNRAARNIALTDYLNDSMVQMREMQAANPDADIYFSEERINQQIETQEAQAEQRPLVIITETTPAGAAEAAEEEEDLPMAAQVIAVGFAVLFVFLSAQNTAKSIFYEKRVGSFRRLIAAPMSRATLLIGKLLPNFILSLIQIVVIFLAAVLLTPLIGIPALDLSSDPLGLIIASLAIALCSTSLGILIAALVKTETQVEGISSGLLWLAGMLGGSIVPVFLFPEGLEQVSRFIPHYWANEAYFGLIFRGDTLPDVLPAIGALLAFSVFFFFIGAWRFDFD